MTLTTINELEFPQSLLDALRQARHVVVFTGAGVSAESGIPTFRDESGYWGDVDPEDFATRAGFRRDPALVWGWYESRRKQVMRSQPNPAHIAIARLARYIEQLTVVTQNIDDLHERAGCAEVLHLHGSFFAPRCFACARPYSKPLDSPDLVSSEPRQEPPRCARCNGRIRPGVVWFGEQLQREMYQPAQRAAQKCDVLFSIGTSSLIYPAASLPFETAARGIPVVQVNPSATDLDAKAKFNLRGQAGDIMPRLLAAAWPDAGEG